MRYETEHSALCSPPLLRGDRPTSTFVKFSTSCCRCQRKLALYCQAIIQARQAALAAPTASNGAFQNIVKSVAHAETATHAVCADLASSSSYSCGDESSSISSGELSVPITSASSPSCAGAMAPLSTATSGLAASAAQTSPQGICSLP